jgi:hypothetical protein
VEKEIVLSEIDLAFGWFRKTTLAMRLRGAVEGLKKGPLQLITISQA